MKPIFIWYKKVFCRWPIFDWRTVERKSAFAECGGRRVLLSDKRHKIRAFRWWRIAIGWYKVEYFPHNTLSMNK